MNPDLFSNKELIRIKTVSGDFSSGVTFSGLTGDSTFAYILEADLTAETTNTTWLYARLNGDAGSNYRDQYVRGGGTATSAGASTSTVFRTAFIDDTSPSMYTFVLYPASGYYRPMLNEHYGIDSSTCYVEKYAGWWTNTADAVTSMLIFASNTYGLSGEIRLYRVK